MGRKVGQLHTKAEYKMYTELDKYYEHVKSLFLHNFVQLAKHHDMDEERMKEFQHNCLAHIGKCAAKLDGETKAVLDTSAT